MPFWKRKPESKPNFQSGKLKSNYGTASLTYEPLTEPNDFRLLVLLPDTRDNSIKCQLNPANLASKPLYNAVSYAWGTTGTSHVIVVNDRSFRVGKNLYEALKDLRHPRDPQTYWVDAICINQHDNKERAAQNGLITAFLDHEYWQRRWIVQEIALASSVVVCSGGITVPLARVKELIDLRASAPRHRPELATQLCNLRESEGEPNSTLEQLLHDFSAAECNEPLDKVYALVSMSKRAREYFKINYDIDRLDLWLGTVEFSRRVECLSAEKVVSFALWLKKELELKAKDLCPTLNRQYRGYNGFGLCPYVDSCLGKRGTVTSAVVPASLFNEVQSLRELCSGIIHSSLPIALWYGGATTEKYYYFRSSDRDIITTWEHYDEIVVSPRDLFAFIWEPDPPSGPEPSRGVWVGFASTRTEQGDMIYQFPGTRIGMLLRRDPDAWSFRIVGRARLAHVAPSGSSMVSENYELPETRGEDTALFVRIRGWYSLRLFKLADDS